MKKSNLFMGTAPLLAMLTFLFLGSASASAASNPVKFRPASLEISQGTAESNHVFSDKKRKKKKKKKPHCEAY